MNEPLLDDSGRFDVRAIAAEIGRRCDEQFRRLGWANRDFHAAQVDQEARRQRWPFIEAATSTEWAPAERALERQFLEAAHRQAVTPDGNERHAALSDRARAIREAVTARTLTKIDAADAQLQAAE